MPGLFYTDITEPLYTNMKEAQVSKHTVKGQSYEIREPVTIVGLRIELASQAPGDIAKKYHLKRINYADLRTKGFMFGLWLHKTVIVYGELE